MDKFVILLLTTQYREVERFFVGCEVYNVNCNCSIYGLRACSSHLHALIDHGASILSKPILKFLLVGRVLNLCFVDIGELYGVCKTLGIACKTVFVYVSRIWWCGEDS